MNKRIIPILLLKDGALVKGEKYKDFRYLGDPINAIKIFNDKEVDEIFFLDISANKTNRPISIELVEQLSEECYMPFGVGGGITNVEEVRQILRSGAEKVTINTSSITSKEIIKEISQEFGSQSLVVSVDVVKNWFGKKKLCYFNGSKTLSVDILSWVKEIESLGAGEIILNSVYNDGMMTGYDLDFIDSVSTSVNIPVIASCGAGKLEHIYDLFSQTNASAAACGSLFVFHGPRKAILINYPNREEVMG